MNNKMRRVLAIISCILGLSNCTKKTSVNEKLVEQLAVAEEKVQEKKPQELKIEIAGEAPTNQEKKFKVEDQDVMLFQEEQIKPIMVAVMAPMSGKYDMIGNGIMDGAHMALIELFNKHKIPVRLTVIDTGSGIEDMEFNISKLDETQFDIILGLTSHEQQAFVESYIENSQHKPKIMALLPGNCLISPEEQVKLINQQDKQAYLVLPMSESEKTWKSDRVKILQYSTDDINMINDDLMKIAKRIEEETIGQRAIVVFTEGNWKLQKFIANSASFKDRIEIILAPISHINTRMEAINEKRHKFGNIWIIGIDHQDYNKFMREFYNIHNRKPLEISFLSYNAVKELKSGVFDGEKWNFDNVNCKPKIKLFEQNHQN